MSDQNLRIVVDALFKGKGEMDKARTATTGLGSDSKKTTSALAGVTKALGAIGVTLGGAAIAQKMYQFGVASVQASVQLEQGLANVSAVSGATGQDLERLKETAKELGATTKFTASQAAEGMQFLAMAGFEVNDIMSAMPGTLQLAAAANLSLGQSADIVSNILTGYGKDVSELAHVNDVLVKAFTSSNVNLTQLGEAMKYAGPVAKGMGIEFEEAAAAIGLMGNAGIQGSMAGTSLRGALTRLANPTREVTDTLTRLGVTVNDSSGKLLSLEEIIRQLETSGADTSDMMMLFGQRAGPAMAALVDQGADALRDFTAVLEDSAGTAERLAKVQMDTLAGDVTLLSSAFDALKVSMGDGANPELRDLVQQLTATLTWVNKNYDAITAAIAATHKWHQAISTMGASELIKWLQEVNRESKANALSMEEVAEAIYAGGGSYEDFREHVRKTTPYVVNQTQAIWDEIDALEKHNRAIDDAAGFDRNFRESVQRTTPVVKDAVDATDQLASAYIDASGEAAEMMGAYDELVVKGARAKEAAIAKAAATDLAAEADRAAASAAQTLATEQGKLFTEALNGTPIQDDLSASIIRAGQAAGLSAEKLAILAGQFGDYTDEAIEAALKSALIAQKMDELVEAFGRGDISVTELRANLARYIETLDAIPDAIATDVTANVRINVNWPSPQEMAAGMPQPAGMPPGTQLYSEGGLVGGGIRGRDSVPALLTPDEIVLPTSATTNMTAAMDFLRDYMPGQTTGTMGGGVNIESGAIVINAGPGMDSGAIADAVLDRIDRQLGQRAGERARL